MKDFPFFAIACAAHGALITINPVIQWGMTMPRPLEKPVTIEFVAAPPLPLPTTPLLAPVAQKGEKPIKKVRRPRITPLTEAQKEEITRRKALAFEKAQALALARAQAARVRQERIQAERQAASELAARRRAEVIERAQRQAEERAQRTRLIAEEKAERARRLAEERAQKARQRAEISQELASIPDPDEELADAPNDAASESVSPRRGKARAASGELNIAGTGDAAALKDSAEPVYELEREGRGLTNSPASGGGIGPGGGSTSWSLEGPVGNRRLLKRTLPLSPEWLSRRGLELSVQIKFQVLEDGSIKAGAVIRKTSGFPEIDQRALNSLKGWKFESIPAHVPHPETWGSVTFRFLMG